MEDDFLWTVLHRAQIYRRRCLLFHCNAHLAFYHDGNPDGFHDRMNRTAVHLDLLASLHLGIFDLGVGDLLGVGDREYSVNHRYNHLGLVDGLSTNRNLLGQIHAYRDNCPDEIAHIYHFFRDGENNLSPDDGESDGESYFLISCPPLQNGAWEGHPDHNDRLGRSEGEDPGISPQEGDV